MEQENKERTKIREYIIGEARKRAELMGENEDVVEKIVEGKQSLVDSGLFDSLSFLDLLSAVEDEFDVEIDMTGYDLEYFVTLDGLTLVTAESETKQKTEEKAKLVASKSAQGISFEELTPQHPCWREMLPMFDGLYEYLERFNLMIKPKPNGAELWLKSLENVVGKTSIIIGAVDDGKLAGYFHAGLKILPIYLEGGYIGIMFSMFVLPEYRKQNVAEDMYEKAYQWLIAHNVSSIETQPMANNNRIIEYWTNKGFEKEIVQIRKMIPNNIGE